MLINLKICFEDSFIILPWTSLAKDKGGGEIGSEDQEKLGLRIRIFRVEFWTIQNWVWGSGFSGLRLERGKFGSEDKD